MTKIVGHRGVGKGKFVVELENTIASFKRAKQIGVDAIEFDVRTTKDDVLVVCHDDNLKRLSGQDLRLTELTYSQLAEVHLLNNETVPLLYDVLAIIGDVPVIIDLKTEKNLPGLFHILNAYPDMDITLATYHRKIIPECKKLSPHIPILVQRAHTPMGFRMSIKKYGADGINVKYSLLNPFTYHAIRKKGQQVQVYSIDNVYVARLFRWLYPNIWIVTNRPDKLIADMTHGL